LRSIGEDGGGTRPPAGSCAGQPVTRPLDCWGESVQEPGDACSVTPGTLCGKKTHTLIRFIGMRVVEVEPIALGHAIQAAAIDPEDLRGAFFIPFSGV
jgi:hypothetical protein